MVLFSMVYGAVPFKGNNMDELHKQIIAGEYELKDDVSTSVRDLLKQILNTDCS